MLINSFVTITNVVKDNIARSAVHTVAKDSIGN